VPRIGVRIESERQASRHPFAGLGDELGDDALSPREPVVEVAIVELLGAAVTPAVPGPREPDVVESHVPARVGAVSDHLEQAAAVAGGRRTDVRPVEVRLLAGRAVPLVVYWNERRVRLRGGVVGETGHHVRAVLDRLRVPTGHVLDLVEFAVELLPIEFPDVSRDDAVHTIEWSLAG